MIFTAVLLAMAQPVVVSKVKTIEGLRPLAFAAAPTGSKFVATLEDGTVRIMDANTRQTVKVLGKHPQPAYAAAWSPDGAYIATGDESARIWLWDTRTGQKVREMRGHIRGIQKLSFNLSRTLLMSTGKDDVVKIWNVTTGKEIKSIPGKGANFYSATFNPKTNVFLVGFLGTGAREYDTSYGVKGFLTGHANQGVWDVAWNANGTRAITGGRDNNAIIWDMAKLSKIVTLKGHQDWVTHVDFSPNGKLAATGGNDRTVFVWNVFNGQQIAKLDGESAVGSPVCFTADGKWLLTSDISDFLQVNSVSPPQAGREVTPRRPVRRGRRKRGG